MMAKSAVNQSYESGLQAGLVTEKDLFHGTFALKDRKEGMRAFLEKKKPQFKDE